MAQITPRELKVAETVGVRVGSNWRNVETDDVIANLYLWLVENERYLESWRQLPDGEAKLYVALRKEAAKFCAAEEAARINRPLDANPAYPVAVLAKALPFMFEDWPVTEVHVNPVTGAPISHPAQIGQAMTILSDISGGFRRLPKEFQEVLEMRFRDGLTLEEVGELRGVTKDGARRQIERALKRLSDSLGSE